MGKLKTVSTLLKLNNKLGLLDLGDVVSLAGTAYRVKNFSPTDYIPDVDFDFNDPFGREERERREFRNKVAVAAAVAGGTYLIAKNRKSIGDNAAKALEKGKEVASDVIDAGKDLANDAEVKGKEVADDVSDKASDVAKKVKNSDVVEDVKDKAEDITD